MYLYQAISVGMTYYYILDLLPLISPGYDIIRLRYWLFPSNWSFLC